MRGISPDSYSLPGLGTVIVAKAYAEVVVEVRNWSIDK